MSKKMLKRSLALGALMAFVITGSAMAADAVKDEAINTWDGSAIVNTQLGGNDLGENSGENRSYGLAVTNGSYTIDKAVDVTNKVANTNRNYGIVLENNTVLTINGDVDVDVEAENARGYGIRNNYGGTLDINTGKIKVDVITKNTDFTVGVGNFSTGNLQADSVVVTATGNQGNILGVTSESGETTPAVLTVKNLNVTAQSSIPAGSNVEDFDSATGLVKGSVRGVDAKWATLVLTGDTTVIEVKSEVDGFAQVIGAMTQDYGSSERPDSVINFNAASTSINVTNTASDIKNGVYGVVASDAFGGSMNFNGETTVINVDGGAITASGIYAWNSSVINSAISNVMNIGVESKTNAYGIQSIQNSTINLADATITATSKEGIAYGVYAKDEETAVNITGDLDITATGYNVARGIEAREGSNVTIGNEDKTNNVTVNAVGTNENASGDWVIGVFSRHDGSSVDIKGDTVTINATATGTNMASGILANTENTNGVAKLDIEANNIIITADASEDGNAAAITTMSGSETTIKGNLTASADDVIYTRGNAKTYINANETTGEALGNTVVLNGNINYGKQDDANNDEVIDATVVINLENEDSQFNGAIIATYDTGVASEDLVSKVTTGTTLGLSNGATWNVTGDSFVNNLKGDGGIITVNSLDADQVDVISNASTNLTVNGTNNVADAIAKSGDTTKALQDLANTVTTTTNDEKVAIANFVTTDEGEVAGAYSATVTDGLVDTSSIKEATNTTNQAIGEAAVALKAHWRAHMNDMNKRMGELRMANGEAGVWTRMVRGEAEYEGAKAQYNQYQLGYDEKLSVDKRWTVGAAVTFAEGEGSYGKGTTEDDSTAFAIYGSKLNNDGTFVDLIARYARVESDVTSYTGNTGDYSTNGYSVSAEFGKRIQQGNGLWIEPQVELTYGTIDSADYKLDGKDVHVGDMDSLIGRVGFSLGKDIKQGNVYARASYLYDFDGETETTFSANGITRPIEEDLGGGWWEVGVGANINLSKATYIYADVEKTFGGEVDTNWQWNLGVRYSF